MVPFYSSQVADVFDAFPQVERTALLKLRALIFETAEELPEVGPLEETLKWGQPAYLTPKTKSGSTLRLGLTKGGGVAVFAHCQTTIISDFRTHFPDTFDYDGNRAVHLNTKDDLPTDAVGLLISSALTYHLRRKR